MMRLLLLCISIVFLSAANACELVLAKDSVANCVIVKGNDTKFCQLGVELLQRCLQSSTGAKFKVVSSSDNIPADTLRIVVGWGEDAQKAGFDVSRFAEEEYMITVKDKTLFLLGKDGGNLNPDLDNIYMETYRQIQPGTYWAVTNFLDKKLGVLWLWPGSGGEYIPKRSKLIIDDSLHIQARPPLDMRIARAIPAWGYLEDPVRKPVLTKIASLALLLQL